MKVLRPIFHISKNILLRIFHPDLRHAFNVESHMTLNERLVLYKLAASTPFIAEIGSYIGASACCFGAAASVDKNTQIICIDTWNNDAMSEGRGDKYCHHGSRHVRQGFL
jgi:hypothetical protein